MIVRARAPLRLGLAGGGTDLSPYCDIYGGCVLNATIDRYAYAVIKELDDSCVLFASTDLQLKKEFSADGVAASEGGFDLHKAVYNKMVHRYNQSKFIPLELTTFCDAPAGSGLGSSSTLVIAMLKAFSELLGLSLDDYTLASLAYEIERVDCQLQGGRQDQYAAVFGGFNFMEFYEAGRVVVNQLRIKTNIICELEASLLLFYTGHSRDSAKIISTQCVNVKQGSVSAIEAMHKLKEEARSMKDGLFKGDFSALVNSMRSGWENKKRLSSAVSNSHIDDIYDLAISAGALAGKVSGAGGGGFMMFFVPPGKRSDVIRALNASGGVASNCHFVEYGAQSWRVRD